MSPAAELRLVSTRIFMLVFYPFVRVETRANNLPNLTCWLQAKRLGPEHRRGRAGDHPDFHWRARSRPRLPVRWRRAFLRSPVGPTLDRWLC